MADRDLVPDVWDLAAAVRTAFEELQAAAALASPDTIILPTAESIAARSPSPESRAHPRVRVLTAIPSTRPSPSIPSSPTARSVTSRGGTGHQRQ